MNIKNLYIKVQSKVIQATKEQLDELLKYKIADYKLVKIAKSREKGDQTKPTQEEIDSIQLKDIELEDLKNIVKQESTIIKHQLLKIRGRFPKLHALLIENSNKVDILEKNLLLKDIYFNEICIELNVDKNITVLPIYLDTDTVFCKIFSVSKDKLDQMLKDSVITIDKYNEFIKKFNYDK